MVEIPEKYLDLLQDKTSFAHLATIMPDGTPQVTPVWFDYTNGKIRVNSAKGRVKSRNMTEGAPIALSILDPDNAYRYIQIRGRVGHVTEEGADAHIDSLAKKYLGKDKYPWASPDQIRVIFEIEPGKVQVRGDRSPVLEGRRPYRSEARWTARTWRKALVAHRATAPAPKLTPCGSAHALTSIRRQPPGLKRRRTVALNNLFAL